jgi:hypothetical protein
MVVWIVMGVVFILGGIAAIVAKATGMWGREARGVWAIIAGVLAIVCGVIAIVVGAVRG